MMDSYDIPACRSCSSLGLPYTTTSNYAFKYENHTRPIPIKRTKSSVNIKPRFTRSNSISSTSGASTLLEASSPSTSMSTSSEQSSNHFAFPAPPSVPQKDGLVTFPKRGALHTRTTSSPAIVTNLMRSISKSGKSQKMDRISQSHDYNASPSFPVDDWREELQTEETERGSLWKLSQRWRHKHGKRSTSSNNMRSLEDWDPYEDSYSHTEEIPPSRHQQVLSRTATVGHDRDGSIDSADAIPFSYTSQSIPSRPGTLRMQTLPTPTGVLPFITRIQSSTMTRAGSAPEYLDQDGGGIKKCEELTPSNKVRKAKERRRRWSPRAFDVNGEWRVHETFQWQGNQPISTPTTTSKDLARCLADSGWTIHRSDELF